jgi:hypothetical protein
MGCPLERGVINLGYTYLFGVRSLTVHLIITTALTAMTTLLLPVILILDHPFAGSFRVNLSRLCGCCDGEPIVPQTPEKSL